MDTQSTSRQQVRHWLDRLPPRQDPPDAQQSAALKARIRNELRRRNAVLIAHYYTEPETQALALETGGCVSDSLEMARFGAAHPAETLVVAGVRFMGETAKILTPEKRVVMVSSEATCSLDLGCPAADFAAFCAAHPERKVVVYANTSAAVKACADWVVTSSVAVDIVSHLHDQGHSILWAPDRFLGDYVRRCTDADLISWQGSCIVHEEFKARGIVALKAVHPDAAVLAHPECPPSVLEIADHIGSTTQIIRFAKDLPQRKFIVSTDKGLFFSLSRQVPDKQFLIAPTAGEGATCRSCAHCPWMAQNSLQALDQSLREGGPELEIDPELRVRAMLPLQRMMDFAAERRADDDRQSLGVARF